MALTNFGYYKNCTNSKCDHFIFFVAIAILLSMVQGAPQFHHRRHQSHHQQMSRYQNDDDHKPKLEWVNPCRGKYLPSSSSTTSSTTDLVDSPSGPPSRKKNLEALEPLRRELQNFIIRLNSSNNAIDTSDISAWFKHNSTFQFLPRINTTMQKINLLRWHSELQVYVGAFQQLLHKQRKFERVRNENNLKSMELKDLMVLSRNALCEIETAINKTGQTMPNVLTRRAMDKRLTFRNNNSGPYSEDIDYLDNKFTKVRFNEYIHSMQSVIERPGNKLRFKKFPLKNGGQKKGGGGGGRAGKKTTNLIRKQKQQNRRGMNLRKNNAKIKPTKSNI